MIEENRCRYGAFIAHLCRSVRFHIGYHPYSRLTTSRVLILHSFTIPLSLMTWMSLRRIPALKITFSLESGPRILRAKSSRTSSGCVVPYMNRRERVVLRGMNFLSGMLVILISFNKLDWSWACIETLGSLTYKEPSHWITLLPPSSPTNPPPNTFTSGLNFQI